MKYVSSDKVPDFRRYYITPGKLYLVEEQDIIGFNITDDEGDVISCYWKNCAQIDGDWEVHDIP